MTEPHSPNGDTATQLTRPKTRRPATYRKHTPQEIDHALLVMASLGGNTTKTARHLAATDAATWGDVKANTLRAWRATIHRDRYIELANAHSREIEEVIVAQARETAVLAAEVERKGLTQLLADDHYKDPSTTVRNASVTKGVNIDQILKLTGRPNQITEHRAPDEIIRSLAQRFPQLTIDSTAEEVADESLLAQHPPDNARE